MKKVVFVSNFFNHHQQPLSEALAARCEYTFIETEEMDAERRGMGWGMTELPGYVRRMNAGTAEACRAVIDGADVVILGSAPDTLLTRRLRRGRLTFKYAERFYKTAPPEANALRNRLAAWLHHGRFQRYPLHMLCASAYTAADCAWSGNYPGRCYQWGYFPETRRHGPDGCPGQRPDGKVSLLWVGRFLEWKHPEAAVLTAERLKQAGYAFELKLIGSGDREERVRAMVSERGLEDCVQLLGTMSPRQVRAHMEAADIFLATSDRNEGWGAVVNEAMNSGCAVVASRAMGCVPFLIRQEENGLSFRSEDWDELFAGVRRLMDDPGLRERYGREACRTIMEQWNAETAAERFLSLAEALERGEQTPFAQGPCARAEILKDDWM